MRRMRRTTKRVIRRRPYRRVRRLRKRAIRVPLGLSKYRNAKLLYSDLNSVSVAASSSNVWSYQTSLFDPYTFVGGHQPMFFDQYAAMYDRYVVFGMSYNIEACTDLATNGPIILTVTPASTAATPTSISMARERQGTKETIIAGNYKGRLRGYISVAKTLGVSRGKVLTDDQYSAAVTANPVQMAYLHISVFNSSAVATTVYLSCRFTYYCRLYDPKEPAQS